MTAISGIYVLLTGKIEDLHRQATIPDAKSGTMEATSEMRPRDDDDPIRKVLSGVQIPLENLEFTLDEFLKAKGSEIDSETRLMLTGIRDSVGYIAWQTREIARPLPVMVEDRPAPRKVA